MLRVGHNLRTFLIFDMQRARTPVPEAYHVAMQMGGVGVDKCCPCMGKLLIIDELDLPFFKAEFYPIFRGINEAPHGFQSLYTLLIEGPLGRLFSPGL